FGSTTRPGNTADAGTGFRRDAFASRPALEDQRFDERRQSASQHRQLQAPVLRAFDRDVVARIRMAHDTGAGIVPQHAGDAGVGFPAAVADDDEAGVLRIAHAYAAAVVEADPGRAARGIEQGVQQRPVADRIAAVAHGFGFAVRGRDAARIEVVAADRGRRLEFAVAHHFVEREAELVALAEADPADA